MVIALERRLRKLEKAEEAKMDKLRVDHEAVMRRKVLEKLRSTPHSRAVLRAYWEQRFRARWAEERKRIEAVTRPEQLARFRRQWAKEHAESETREEEYLKEAKVTREGLESFLREIIEGP
jgi:hypothetical protein